MARTVIGRVTFALRHAPSLATYRQATLAGIPAIMRRSEQRLKEDVVAHTPVDTGHMRDNLLSTSDLAEVTTEYTVFWRSQEFVGEVNPRGKIIQGFYPATLILGGPAHAARYPHLLTQETEAERPKLLKELRDHFAGR